MLGKKKIIITLVYNLEGVTDAGPSLLYEMTDNGQNRGNNRLEDQTPGSGGQRFLRGSAQQSLRLPGLMP